MIEQILNPKFKMIVADFESYQDEITKAYERGLKEGAVTVIVQAQQNLLECHTMNASQIQEGTAAIKRALIQGGYDGK